MVSDNDKSSWHEQLNCYAHLIEMNKDKPEEPEDMRHT